MLRAIANVGAVATAVLAWAALTGLILWTAGADVLGLAGASRGSAAPPLDQLCALAVPLGQGFDRHCDFTARLGPEPAGFRVTLDETWEGTALVQRLAVKAPTAPAPAYALATRSVSATGASRLSQIALVAATPREDHLAYSLGGCGAIICGQHEVVVVALADGAAREVLRVRLGRAGGFEVIAGGIVTLEPFIPVGGGAAAGSTARTYVWDGGAYALQAVAFRAAPSPSLRPR